MSTSDPHPSDSLQPPYASGTAATHAHRPESNDTDGQELDRSHRDRRRSVMFPHDDEGGAWPPRRRSSVFMASTQLALARRRSSAFLAAAAQPALARRRASAFVAPVQPALPISVLASTGASRPRMSISFVEHPDHAPWAAWSVRQRRTPTPSTPLLSPVLPVGPGPTPPFPVKEPMGVELDTTAATDQTNAKCAWDLVYNGAPNVVTVAFWHLIQVLAAAAVGNYLGANDLAAASIAYYSFCFLALYPGMGMAAAVDTINSQAYGADPMSTVQGEMCQRSLFINCVMLVPMALLLLCTEPLFAWLYNPSFGARVGTWHRYSLLFLAAQMHFNSLAKFLNNQFKQHLLLIPLFVAAVCVFPLSVLFIDHLKMGIAGAPLAMGVASTLQLIVTATLIYCDEDARARFGPLMAWSELTNKEDMKTFLGLGLPSIVFVAGESGAFDFVVLYAGTLGDVEGAAWSTVQSTMLISQSTSSALSVAASTLIGQAVGAGMKDQAKRYATIAPIIAAALASIVSVVVVLNHRAIFSLMTPDEAVQQKIETLLWVIPIYHVLDCTQYVFQGVFSGCGQNEVGAYVLLSTLWGIGVPLAIVGGKFYGLPFEVAGFTVGMAIELPLLLWVMLQKFDWEPVAWLDNSDDEDDDEQNKTPEEKPPKAAQGDDSAFHGTV